VRTGGTKSEESCNTQEEKRGRARRRREKERGEEKEKGKKGAPLYTGLKKKNPVIHRRRRKEPRVTGADKRKKKLVT
jgi:hypothetical protein